MTDHSLFAQPREQEPCGWTAGFFFDAPRRPFHRPAYDAAERGRIVERGAHRELMANNGLYRELHDRQYRIETDRFVNPGEDFLPAGPSSSEKAAVEEAAEQL